VKWSFSSLKQFTNCPRQYYEVRVAQNVQTKVTQQMLYGTEVHKALEDYVRDGKELPLNYKRFKPMIDALLSVPGERYVEHKMALNESRKQCKFDAPEYWVRGIVDLMIVDDDTAFIVDYKTGSNRYPDPKQLKLMALMTFEHFPAVERIKGGLLFVMHDSFMPEEYLRKDISKLWLDFAQSLMRMTVAYEKNVWTPNPTGLCGWCPVTSCEFYRSK
jgi:CRISPR/Cas system-associated exonuclease Cas4 (RecB family)